VLRTSLRGMTPPCLSQGTRTGKLFGRPASGVSPLTATPTVRYTCSRSVFAPQRARVLARRDEGRPPWQPPNRADRVAHALSRERRVAPPPQGGAGVARTFADSTTAAGPLERLERAAMPRS